ncbi:hypothetical protein BRD17_05465 [Halobacteriales archaeon SW_7_68_16]|nr:MAG: hypothetical protein BRD17_05465 [Halobacteriales archaeon SW_7_68_16]
MSYVVSIKPSARRVNGAVGRAIVESGSTRRFADRETAESWAAGLTDDGGATVWIRTATRADTTDADGYLVGRRRNPTPTSPPGQQAVLVGGVGRSAEEEI